MMTGRGALKSKTKMMIIGVALAILICIVIASVGIGTVFFSPKDIATVVFKNADNDFGIIKEIRIPRIFLGILVGMNLSVAGVLLQGIFKNPMASPNIIGVNAGAGLAAVCIMALYPHFIQAIPIAAFLGAVLTAGFIFLMAGRSQGASSTIQMVLAGVAVSHFLKAMTAGIMSLNADTLDVTYIWLLGSLSGRSWPAVYTILPYTVVGILLAWFISPKINLFSLGEEMAISVGLKVGWYRGVVVFVSAFLAGSAISVAGTIGFVGLIAPHISRMIIGGDHKYLVPMSALNGAILLTLSDTFARNIFRPVELSVGIVTAALGGPFFLLLLKRKKKIEG